MSSPGRGRWRSSGGHRVVAGIVILATLVTVGLVGANAALLGRMTTEVQEAENQSTNLSNSLREALRLLQLLTELGETSDPKEIAVQRGLLKRQLAVTIAAFPAGSAEAAELRAIHEDISSFPWDRLPETGGHESPLRLTGMGTVSRTERRINALRSEEEKSFYSTTIRSLDAKRRSELALVALVSLVVALGAASVVSITRRSRSDLANAYDAVRASEARFRSLVQRASDLTVVTDAAGTVTYVSPAAEGLLGVRPESLLDTPLSDHVEPAQRAEVAAALEELTEAPGTVATIELRLLTADGRTRWVEAVCRNLVGDPAVAGVVWNGRDVTERRALEDELTRQANHDPLTGLPNRALLLRRLSEALRDVVPSQGTVSVLLVDLDGFKNVNDTLGHPAGDELLQRAAERLRGCVLTGDTAARLGGDEFAIVIASGRPEHAIAVGRRIVDALGQPIAVGGEEVRISASVGVAHRDGPESAEDLLRDADLAMYVAKHTGKGHVQVFEPDMRTRAARRTSLMQELARAVELGEIEVHYQPIVDLATGRTSSLEALARWRHPTRTMVPPDVFIPIAEESGAIGAIGREVLRAACRSVAAWRAAMPQHDDLGIAVNVSVHQVLSGRLVDDVVESLHESGLPATALTLEITESTLLEDSAPVVAEFARLQQLGVRIAVDDFGSGYSSLGFLLGLNADILKIDRTLLDFDTTRHGSLVQAITELGRTLGLKVVAEGVETSEHLTRAREAMCDAAQGYHFSRPLVAEAVAPFLLAAHEAPRPAPAS